MDARALDTTVRMLQTVLQVRSYNSLAAACGVSPSAVEQRVKALGRDLQLLVGVEGVDEDEVPTVPLMRAHKSGYVEALEHYAPQRRITNGARAGPLAREDLARAVAITRRRNRHPERDVALLLVLFATRRSPWKSRGSRSATT